ncbi:PEP-CTERM sorting domain-containing protein [Poriferisphaera sp. WC338]|uniref:PEP-CTERM sorting domain-containing protein n=1 Tax=Poriferisphaera sp. WC338 TaxID=3425129 RepID=UPI003D8165E3
MHGKRLNLFCTLSAAATCAITMSPSSDAATLAHQWNFDEVSAGPPYTAAADSVGGANFDEFIGSGYTQGGGVLTSVDADGASLNNFLAGSSGTRALIGSTIDGQGTTGAVTFELVFTQSVTADWAKLLVMGYGEWLGASQSLIAITPKHLATLGGNKLTVEIGALGTPEFTKVETDFVVQDDTEYYLAAEFDDANDLLTMYIGEVGGTLHTFTGAMTYDLGNLNIHGANDGANAGHTSLGGAIFWDNTDWSGEYDQFNIYTGDFSAAEANANFAALIPEPAAAFLLGFGSLMIAGRRKRA